MPNCPVGNKRPLRRWHAEHIAGRPSIQSGSVELLRWRSRKCFNQSDTLSQTGSIPKHLRISGKGHMRKIIFKVIRKAMGVSGSRKQRKNCIKYLLWDNLKSVNFAQSWNQLWHKEMAKSFADMISQRKHSPAIATTK